MNRTVMLPLKVLSSGLQRVNDGVGYEQDRNVTSTVKVSSSGLQCVNDGVGYEQDRNVTSISVVIRIAACK